MAVLVGPTRHSSKTFPHAGGHPGHARLREPRHGTVVRVDAVTADENDHRTGMAFIGFPTGS
jgi:hypothetical protein